MPTWKHINTLIAEQKYQAALEEVLKIRDQGPVEERTRAQIEATKLRIALSGYETAVRELLEAPRPEDPTERDLILLYSAHALIEYARNYAWEIRQREMVDTGDEVDLKRWTMDQIVAEANRRLDELWSHRREWGQQDLGKFAPYFRQNNYPKGILDTLRDTVTYLWVDLLADTSYWKPGETDEVYRLDLASLADGNCGLNEDDLENTDLHPLLRICFLLGDLEAWHAGNEQPEAALEALMTRQEILDSHVQTAEEHRLLREKLGHALLGMDSSLPWWSMGMARLAGMVRSDEEDPGALVRARSIASEGMEGHSGPGAAACKAIISSIEAPRYSTDAMAVDGLNQRSIRVHYRDLAHIYFRAYTFDLREQIRKADDYNILPGYQEIPDFLGSHEIASEWTMELPPTPDFRSHAAYSTPRLPHKGCYVIISSMRPDFALENNDLEAMIFFASDLVLSREERPEGWEVTARDGNDGKALEKVRLEVWKADWQHGHHLLQTLSTDRDGRALIRLPDTHSRLFLLGRNGEDLAFVSNLPTIYRHENTDRDHVFLYTDRSVYRPGQEIHFKAVAFSGGGEDFKYRTRPGLKFKISLHDANGEEIDAIEVKTNDFGSASGSFRIPSGRMLGAWLIQSSFGPGSASIRVEEYKRPTFEVEITDPAHPLRLNREAVLEGNARYYFGLPVTEGKVDWRVTREPVYPRWWWWPRPSTAPQVIAAGESSLDADGNFKVSFIPPANEALAEKGLTYRFRLSVDVVEAGGETRKGTRVFRLGYTAIEASIEDPKLYIPAGRSADIHVLRSDLDGTPRAGEGRWTLFRLLQPDETRMPSEEPLPPPEHPDTYQTEGDRIRPRWNSNYDPGNILRNWKAGEELDSGTLDHGENGRAALRLPELKPGCYRLVYETRDSFGSPFKLEQQLIAGASKGTRLHLPAFLAAEQSIVHPGESAKLFVASGFRGQEMLLELFHGDHRIERKVLEGNTDTRIIEIPVGEELRGGFGVVLTMLRDHQQIQMQEMVFVPWDDRKLQLKFSSFRDRIHPGEKEKFRIHVTAADGQALAPGTAEVLAYMYDRSLDIFAPHNPPNTASLYPILASTTLGTTTLGTAPVAWQHSSLPGNLTPPSYYGDRLVDLDAYGIGGPGRRNRRLLYKSRSLGAVMPSAAPPPAPMEAMVSAAEDEIVAENTAEGGAKPETEGQDETAAPLRSNFAETAFFQPSITLDSESSATIEFTAPDSVTDWNLWIHALSTDLRGVSEKKQLATVKDLMVRPAVPRFFREGDEGTLLVTINNAGEVPLEGSLRLALRDPESGESLLEAFNMDPAACAGTAFRVEAGKSVTLPFHLLVPPRPGMVAFEVSATAGDFSDGELRPLPILPGRMHLMQSRFAALHDRDRRELRFEDMASEDDPSRIDEQLVVSLDAQLFYSVLNALPYLIEYPYECTEQTLNRFLSTGIVSSVFSRYPSVAEMARQMATRDTRLESWDTEDPNRKMTLEESPWLLESRGGSKEDLIRILDPEVAAAQRGSSLAKLRKAQTSSGAFPWWPGGPPSPWMTLYVLAGFSHAMEFDVEVPEDMIRKAWQYTHRHYLDRIIHDMEKDHCCWESVTWLNFILSSYPDESWSGGVFTREERLKMLDFSFSHWKEHSPRMKSCLALTLKRMGRSSDAVLVWESVMDSSRNDPDLGLYWAREDRSWLWYNDTTETHAMALRTLTELAPDDPRREGLVQWIFLDKKLNHWKSTRATAEVIYSVVHYLEHEGQLGITEKISVKAGPIEKDFVFTPESYTGNNAQLFIPGEKIIPSEMSTIIVEKDTPGLAFATASWHFSTEKLPEHGDGDLFTVERKLYLRSLENGTWTLKPLEEGRNVAVGDQVEVELRIRARHEAEYVHLRDPRASGFEPESLHSGYRWNLGVATYEEIRDSGENFFFENLPAGEYTFRYRIRATMAGRFKLAPAVLQSMYAPEFGAYSAGQVLEVLP